MDNELAISIFEAMEQVDSVETAEAVADAFCRPLAPYGFTACLITTLPLPHERRWHESIFVNAWPREWYERYNEQGHYRHDPCAAHARRSGDPFFWSDVQASIADEAALVMSEARDFGLRQGICLPVHVPFRPPAAVTVSGERIDLPPGALQLVHALAHHAARSILRMKRRSQEDDTPRLSGREREALQWVGAGKTTWEISRILGISTHTVATHLRNAREKLGTVNITQAVAEALRRREIEF